MAAIKGGAALIKGCFPTRCSASDWPEGPEEACIKHAEFLRLWMPYAFNKPDAREAWKEAFPSMPAAARDGIVNKCGEARKWLGRKWRNMKTGEKTHPKVKELMASVFKEETTPKRSICKEPAKGSSPSAKPAEAMAKQLPVAEGEEKPEEACTPTKGLRSKTSPVICMVMREDVDCNEAEEVLSVSSASVGVVPVQVLISNDQPATGMKKPAAGMKKPVAGKATLKRPASLKQAWKQSVSHGMVKATLATQKAYIVCKGEDGKERSLVNIALAKGDRQASIVAQLMLKLENEPMTKEQLVELKNNLLHAAED